MKKKQSTFCPLPWNHLSTQPNGAVTLCCEAHHIEGAARDSKNVFKNLYSDSIDETLNSDYFKETRKKMLCGEIPKACGNCFLKESNNVESKRLAELKTNVLTEEIAREKTKSDGQVDIELDYIELRLSNKCNLKCRSCNPFSSSMWFEETKKYKASLPFIDGLPDDEETFKWAERDEFWSELDLYVKNARKYYINGGEPLLNRNHLTFLEDLTRKNSKIIVEYSTNMTIMSDKILNVWKKIPGLTVLASIDDLGSRNTYLRFPTKWETVTENLDKLIENNINVLIMQTVGAINFYYLGEFFEWAQSKRLPLAHNFIRYPNYMRIDALPLQARIEIIEKLKKELPDYLMNPILNLWQEETDGNEFKKLLEFTEVIDGSRNENINDTFPELGIILNNLK
jgi:organic radical activating enzyme